MLLPTTETSVLILLVVSILCLGAWASSLKMVNKWRYEFMGYDFAWGVAITAVVAAFTLGQWDTSELTFQDNFLLTGYRKMAWATGSGIIFMLANLMLLAAISVSNMTMAFALAFSLAWAIGAGWMMVTITPINPVLALGGAGVLVLAGVLAAVATRWHLQAKEEEKAEALRADPKLKKTPVRTAGKGIILSVIAGLTYGGAFLALNNAVIDDTRVSSYGAVLLMAVGVFCSTALYVPFFLNFPVQGSPLSIRRYTQGSLRSHLLGIGAGVVWMSGILAWLVTGESDVPRLDIDVAYILGHAAPLVAILLGLFVWREFQGTVQRARLLLLATLVLFAAGVYLVAVSPLYGG